MEPAASSVADHSAAVCGRFAPSPTGWLHAGSIHAAVASFLSARSAGGRWLVRIEDVDTPRERPGSADAILADLRTLGLDWDGPVWRQSERSAAYAQALEELRGRGAVFACACSRADLAPTGIHSDLCKRPLTAGISHAWRMRVPDAVVGFADRFQGRYQQSLRSEVGDVVLRRRDGLWAYHLAVVVDDAAQGISEIIRGADLLDSTPRQIHLQRLLGLTTPAYGHVPLLLDEKGQKLSKSRRSTAFDRRNAVQALRQALAGLGQPETEGDSCSAILARAIAGWDVTQVPQQPSLPCRMRADFGREYQA
jgi:glutamyl-Q tRNA(Asp) synthetase